MRKGFWRDALLSTTALITLGVLSPKSALADCPVPPVAGVINCFATDVVGNVGAGYTNITVNVPAGASIVPANANNGVLFDGNLNTLNNAGTIFVTSNNWAVNFTGNQNTGVNESGGIISASFSSAFGIYMKNGTFTNSGLVVASAVSYSAVGVFMANGTFTNAESGIISAFAAYSSAVGVSMDGGVFTNAGSIIANAHASSYAIGVDMQNGTFVNTGSISAFAGSSVAIGVRQENGTFTNSGSILAFASYSAYGVVLSAGTFTNEASGIISAGGSASAFGVSMDGGVFTNLGAIGASVSSSYAVGVEMDAGTFTNAGTISAFAPSSWAVGVLMFGGDLINSGTISAATNYSAAFGVRMDDGTVTNSGTIAASASISAVGLAMDGGTVTNTGIISADASFLAVGVSMNDGTVTNSGSILATALSLATGVSMNGGVLNNSGFTSIRANASFGAFGVVMNDGTFNNTGLVSANALSLAIGVSMFNGVLNNSGIVEASASFNAFGVTMFQGNTTNAAGGVIRASAYFGAIGVGISSASATFTNSGVVQAIAGSSVAIGVSMADGVVTNTGTGVIEAIAGSSFAVGVSMQNGVFTNEGLITASTKYGIGFAAGVIQEGGVFTNSSTGVIRAKYAVSLYDSANPWFTNHGAIEATGAPGTGWAVHVDGLGSFFENYGSTKGNIIVDDSAALVNEGQMIFRVQWDPSDGFDDILVESGGVLTTTGGLVVVNPLAGVFANTTLYPLFINTSGGSGSFTGLVAGTNPNLTSTAILLEPSLAVNGGDASSFDLILHRLPFNSPKVVGDGVGGTFNQKGVGGGLEGGHAWAFANPDSPFSQILGQIQVMGTADEIQRAYDYLSGEIHNESQTAGLLRIEQLMNAVQGQLFDRGPGGLGGAARAGGALAYGGSLFDALAQAGPGGSRPPVGNTWAVWGAGYGSRGDVDGGNGFSGYDIRMAGFHAGVDVRVTPEILVGVVGGYQKTDIELHARPDKTDSTSAQGGVYGAFQAGPLQATATVTIGRAWYETDRFITVGTFNAVASSEYDGRDIGAGAQLSYTLRMGTLAVQPLVDLRFANAHTDAFTETGAPGANLAVEDASASSLRPGIGVRVSTNLGTGLVWTPEARAKYSYDVLDDDREILAQFAGVPGSTFVSQGRDPGRHQGLFGLGLGVHSAGSNMLRVFVDYNADVRDNMTGHTLSGGIRLAW